MYKYNCLNPIAGVGLDLFSDEYTKVDELKDADAALVRSAAMHDLEVTDNLLAVARAGAGVNNIPLEQYAKKGIVADKQVHKQHYESHRARHYYRHHKRTFART